MASTRKPGLRSRSGRELGLTLEVAAALATLALLAAACAGAASSSIGGSASLGPVVAEEPFYDPANGQVLGDARIVSSRPLADFDVPDTGGEVVDGSVSPIGESGALQVAAWTVDDPEAGLLECVGFRVGRTSAGSTCGDAASAEEVFFEVRCVEGEPPEWRAFTIGGSVTALRLEVDGDLPVIGDDPDGTGLIAVEAVGTVSRVTAQTTEVRLVEVAADCPGG